MAIKVLGDGISSANIVTLIDWNDQEGFDFFPKNKDGSYKPFTTVPPTPTSQCFRQTMGRKLSEGVGSPFQSGSSSWAMKTNADGGFTNLKEPGILELKDNNFPWEVSFLPNGAAIPAYVEGTDPFDYIASIKKVEGEPLFYMQARDQPGSEL